MFKLSYSVSLNYIELKWSCRSLETNGASSASLRIKVSVLSNFIQRWKTDSTHLNRTFDQDSAGNLKSNHSAAAFTNQRTETLRRCSGRESINPAEDIKHGRACLMKQTGASPAAAASSAAVCRTTWRLHVCSSCKAAVTLGTGRRSRV